MNKASIKGISYRYSTTICDRKWHDARYDLTVIIPCYNGGRYVAQSIESVVDQSKKYSVQVVVINDGSTDNSLEVISSFSSHDNLVVISQENQGLSKSRNVGMDNSEGEYLLFLDADDYLINGAIDKLLDAIKKTGADCVEGKMVPSSTEDTHVLKCTDSLSQGFVTGAIYKRECFNNICFPEGYIFEDTINKLRLSDNIHLAYFLDASTYFYRSNEEGITRTAVASDKSIQSVWVTLSLIEDRKKLGLTFEAGILEELITQFVVDYIRIYPLGETARREHLEVVSEVWSEIGEGYFGANLSRRCFAESIKNRAFETYDVTAKLIWEEIQHSAKAMNVAISITEDYIDYAYVMLTSLFESNKNRRINTYILYNGISDEKLSVFGGLEEKYSQTIICQEILDDWIPEGLWAPEHWPKEVYFRCYLPEVLPEDADRVLYIDVDTIVNKNLRYLYDEDFMDQSIIACRDQSVLDGGLTEKQLTLFNTVEGFEASNYFNSGVILFNLKKIRSMFGIDAILEMAVKLKDYLFAPDQDLLNYIFYGDVFYEEPELYNAFARLNYNKGKKYDYMKKNACIVHFAGRKPWTPEAIRYDTEAMWWENAKKAPTENYLRLLENLVFSEIKSNFINDEFVKIINRR